MPADEKFWDIGSVADGIFMSGILRRRFPQLWAALSAALEEADPLDVVYPGNPDEYSDVVKEVIVLLAPYNGDIKLLSREDLTGVIRRGLARCFGEAPDEARLELAVEKLSRGIGLRLPQTCVLTCAGINRHEGGDGRAPRRRASEPAAALSHALCLARGAVKR